MIIAPPFDITVSMHQRISYSAAMRTTLTLENDVYEAAQAMAQASGQRLGEVVSILMRRGLKASAETSAVRSGLPVFQVVSGDPIIPSNRARELLADEAP
jgi:hypothetical protein